MILHREDINQYTNLHHPILISSFAPPLSTNCYHDSLLPSVLLLPPEDAIRYLEFALDQLHCQEQAVHHQLLLLYAQSSTGDKRLLDYLRRHTLGPPAAAASLCEVFEDLRVVERSAVPEVLSSAYSAMESGRLGTPSRVPSP